ncbi:hypothetical protein PVAP13_3KG098200 [Panicum virgatum]|uniref:Uncharacterized protein n=1 Tax=Panicum virgatum TaxID=38727 RepID=A0A8T0UTE4_PANVG|nr:hypothetical protein PVAP13_3KG098200 [Panicum virgatum]
MHSGSTIMTTFSFKPPPPCSSSRRRSCHVHVGAAAASPPPLIRRCPSVSWRWRLRQHTCRLQRGQQSPQQNSNLVDEDDSRLSQNAGIFHPSIWGDFFLGYSNPAAASSQQQTQMAERADKLKEEVAGMIASSTVGGQHERLHLIDTLERLCLDHLFEEEISAALPQIEAAGVIDCDLGTVALWFSLLRRHRYRVSPDVFARFKNEEGGFLADNPEDLLSLYNAAHMGTHGETILDEAIVFTRRRLETTLRDMEESSLLAREIKSALEIPLPRRVRIYESKHYISAYEQDDATVHETVLQLAKLNSNIMQLHHQHDLEIITRWWEGLHVESRFPFARDRVVECYLWILGVYYEPCYSRSRIILTMIIAIVTLLDDIYDSYATPEECKILTKCIESWDAKAAHDLPECIKFALGKILDSFQTIENMLHQEEKYRMSYLKYFVSYHSHLYFYLFERNIFVINHLTKALEESNVVNIVIVQ